MTSERIIGSRAYRYGTVHGLECRELYSLHWKRVDGAMLEGMSSKELRLIADVMDEAMEGDRDE